MRFHHACVVASTAIGTALSYKAGGGTVAPIVPPISANTFTNPLFSSDFDLWV